MRCKHCEATEVWQVAYDEHDVTFARRISLRGARPAPSGWLALGSPGIPSKFEEVGEGFFCVGCERPRPDVRGACKQLGGEKPMGELPPCPTFDLDGAIALLRKVMAERVGDTVQVSSPRPASFVRPEKLSRLAPAARALLHRDLYEHQALAIEAAVDGKNVVISTDTASGKSLCYQTVVAHLAASSRGTTLYLAPLNALLVDQLDGLEQFLTGVTPPVRAEKDIAAYLRRLAVGDATLLAARYDGGVPRDPREIRQEIRRAQPSLVLATPEMVTQALLPFASPNKGGEISVGRAHGDWRYFFQRLRLIIIDELHAFRGVFGAHLANTLRRVRRMVTICGGEDAQLQFFACSATIRDPVATAQAVSGADGFHLIGRDQDKSPRYQRTLVPITSNGERLTTFGSRLLQTIAATGGARTIAFRDHIPQVQAIAKILGSSAELRGRVQAYTANARADDKLDRLRGLRSGGIQCLVSTSALELGIDVGALNASVLLGYPGSISRTWQMLGRAGRNGDGLLVYVSGPGYLDEYWRNHADELVGDKAQPEDVIVDPDNVEIVQEHLRAAALDHVLSVDRDRRFFGPAFDDALEALKTDVVEGVRLEDDVWILRASGERRAREISLRGIGQYKVPVHLDRYDEDAKPLYEEQSDRAPRRLFPGATFVWDGHYYMADRLVIPEIDPTKKERPKVYAIVREVNEPGYLTTAKVSDDTHVLDQRGESTMDGSAWGRVQVTSRVEGYYKSAEAINEIEGAGKSKAGSRYVAFTEENEPPRRAYRTLGAWFPVPDEVLDAVAGDLRGPALNTMAEAFVRAAPLLRFASPGDLAASVYENHPDFPTPSPVVFVHETVVGGAGLARSVFERRVEMVEQAHKLLRDCEQCNKRGSDGNGCPRCVALMDGSQDRRGAMLMLEAWATTLKSTVPPRRPTRPRPSDPAWVLRQLGLTGTWVGRGGMGQVLRASRGSDAVAIKIIAPSTADRDAAEFVKALEFEAEQLRELEHPSIVKLRAFHKLEGGVVALELDWLDGGTLEDYLADERRQTQRLRVWRSIVDAVAYLHLKGVVHRDLKPDNILMRTDEPVIADFGIARQAGRLTRGMGTPDWEAPEQRSSNATVTPRMDVYALGLLLSYVTTGTINVLAQRAPNLDQIPTELHAVLRTCLSVDARKRFADAGEIIKALGLVKKKR